MSAEWAVGIVAAVAIAGVLLAIITNGQVEDGAAQVHPDGDQLVLGFLNRPGSESGRPA